MERPTWVRACLDLADQFTGVLAEEAEAGRIDLRGSTCIALDVLARILAAYAPEDRPQALDVVLAKLPVMMEDHAKRCAEIAATAERAPERQP